ncbi:hypothetical protein [Novosphingobium marinum]|uniref:Uncharacterized protein n=1 Tax=Novosphingobium marinum TaxID=1514948 RepID=A0A7Y9XY53_9SPHN|nr:hypothetical protein [Novosphingobium marinum]NYH96776.1 hypothetical protein [Novosphingobium marinum]
MSTAIFALALFGCADDGTYCERLAFEADTYRTEASCRAAQMDALDSDAARGAQYPSVIAKCMDANSLARLGSGPVNLAKPTPALARGKSRANGV